MGVRQNITADPAARDRFLDGVRRLKREQLGITAADLAISTDTTPISTYDLFVVWHHLAMNVFTPPDQQDRNAAHRGPVFLPWHRFMLIVFELQLQRVLHDDTFGLPYWDWAADGELSPADQPTAPVWADNCLGGDGSPISRGPFAFDPTDDHSWRVRVEVSPAGRLRLTNRGLRRTFGRDIAGLPRQADVTGTLDQDIYDTAPWSTLSGGFRNQLEGWQRSGPRLHNQVHVWIGGDMSPSSSPNDPVFYLNHCNVDRIWAGWQQQHRAYLPDQTEPAALFRHRINDPMFALLTQPLTPRQTLDVTARYTYDNLPQ